MSVQSIFSGQIFEPPRDGDKSHAAVGFTQIFGAMLAKQMRNAMAGDEGPLGTGGGTTGDVYGAFFDDAMGRALATSPAMKGLNQAIERELASHGHQSQAKANNIRPVPLISHSLAIPEVTQNRTELDLPSDSLGPLLLPPEPTLVASELPPPPRWED
jgi:Rod binding domain-containing protein